MNQKDIKLLWGRSGNRCAICRRELSQDFTAKDAAYNLGHQAHIIGESESAARGTSNLSDEERESYPNRILLCPNHHTEIDNDVELYTIERVHYIKSTHELWVRETLADSADQRALAGQVAVTSIVDAAVELCQLQNWKVWASDALSSDPRWQVEMPEAIFEFRQRVEAAIWPDGLEELKRATKTLSILLQRAKSKFLEHADRRGDYYFPDKFYKDPRNPLDYGKELTRYQKWLDDCYELIHESARAANWFGDIVRRDVNPMFFVEKGKFVVIDGPFSPDLAYYANIPEFSDEEKAGLPGSLFADEEVQKEDI